MRRALFLFLLVAVAFFSLAPTVARPDQHYIVRVQLVPGESGPYHLLPGGTRASYRATAVVCDENDKVIVTTKPMVVAPGDTREIFAQAGGLDVTFKVKVSRDATGAQTDVTVKRLDEVVARSSTSIVL